MTSLVAARDGSIAESVKDTLNRTTEVERKSTLGISFASAKLGTESRVRGTDSSSKEVVRRSVIQSTFRDLRTGGIDDIHLAREPVGRRQVREGSIETFAELLRNEKRLRKCSQILPVRDIKRGDVLEFEIELEAHKTYRLVSAISSIVEIVKGRESLFGLGDGDYNQVLPIVEVIDRLLFGLVPVQGVSTRFNVVYIDGEECIVDRRVLNSQGEVQRNSHPLEVVGVTDFQSYSRDLRRVLFGDLAYTAYMRVERSALLDTWNPIKLADVLGGLSGELVRFIEMLPDGFDEELSSREDPSEGPQSLDLVRHFVRFGEGVAALKGTEIDRVALATVAVEASGKFKMDDIDSRRSAFDLVVNAIDENSDREDVRRLRETTISEISAGSLVESVYSGGQPIRPVRTTRKMEVEFVAIYW
ncbi:hypothetical protein [Micromonospora sp. LOL_015]|uniref:DUF6414 family protein n=1 Tax=Micromonospora sp. LOL_015 TaxID=3345416 RepID=UPI003A8C0C6F